MESSKKPEFRRARGAWAERLVSVFLEGKGYVILCRNFTCRGGELDIVAEQGEVLCFVEVRYKSSVQVGEPLETIAGIKRARLIKTARRYLADHPEIDPMRRVLRFDVVSVVGEENPQIALVKNAFSSADAW